MGIDLYWEGEKGNLLDSVYDSKNLFARVITQSQLSNTTCLHFIDPYGDTTFNQLQIPVLIQELESMLESVSNFDSREQISKMLNLARQSRGQVHTYLKFYGD